MSIIRLGVLIRTLIAYFLYPLFGARNVGQLLGIIPHLPFHSAGVARESFPPPHPFLESALDPQPSTFWDRPKPLKASRHHVLTITRGQADESGSVFDYKGRPVSEGCHPLRQRSKYRWQHFRSGICVSYMKKRAQPRIYSGRIGVLTSSNQHIYSHWLLDVLPRIAKLQQHGKVIDFFFLQYAHPFQIETLTKLNCIQETTIINCDEIPWVSGDELIVPCHQIMFGYHHPHWACQWLRETFCTTTHTAEKVKRKIYISRSLAKRRKITNEIEISACLWELGFEIWHLERLPFLEQVRLFQESDFVVAPHGSGLANLVFCSPGTKVVELFPARATDAYFRLSVDMKLTYRCLKTRERSQRPRVSDDFSINVEDLREALSVIHG